MCPLLTVPLYVILRIFGKVLVTKLDLIWGSGVASTYLVHAHLVTDTFLDIYL